MGLFNKKIPRDSLPLDFITRFHAVFIGKAAGHFHHKLGIAGRRQWVIGQRSGVFVDVQNPVVSIHEYDVEGDKRVAHPKALLFGFVKKEKHALAIGHRLAVHEAQPALHVVIGLLDVDGSDDLPAYTIDK